MPYFLSFLFAMAFFLQVSAQSSVFYHKQHSLQWETPDSIYMEGYETVYRLYFDDARFGIGQTNNLPWFYTHFHLFDKELQLSPQLSSMQTEPLTDDQLQLLNGFVPDTVFETRMVTGQAREKIIAGIYILPIRTHPENGTIERLLDFKLQVELEDKPYVLKTNQREFVENSVLATGNWYKIKSAASGVHRITYNDLEQMGINAGNINPRNIRLYGHGGGMLPEENDAFYHVDLVEMPVLVSGENNGQFNQGDQILFYGRGPVTWDYNATSGYFEHNNHHYEDFTYYFLTTDLGPGKRMQAAEIPQGPVDQTLTDFLDYQVYEQDLVNLINMGRTWYGEVFDFNLKQDFEFNFSHVLSSKPGHINVSIASRNFNPANFQVSVNGELKATIPTGTVSPTGYGFAVRGQTNFVFNPSSANITVSLQYNRSANTSRGWLDYIGINVWRSLQFNGPQMHFRNPGSTGIQIINEYRLSQAGQDVNIWDISNPVDVKRVNTNLSGNTLSWKSAGDQLREYLAFDGSSYHPVTFVEQVQNQNLHALRDIDYLIIAHPDFRDQAERLADTHRSHQNMTVYVTEPQYIYNEFSSGGQDISAIRNFVRMLYEQSTPGKQIQYLLLFGGASFDYKDRINGNTNFVPTWQSDNSLHIVTSIATDDFYGYLDDGEGGDDANFLDIGIGRFPVNTPLQARQAVDKVESYLRKDEKTMGPWRNIVTFVADDGDSNIHLNDAENVSGLIQDSRPVMNIDKIYLDAYPQIATPGGQKAPEVNQAINRRMERGTLVMNYSGHGGEVGWAEERILEIADIQSWRNMDMLPVFITATCEFSRFDDPERTSAGEMVFLNHRGGAIAMFTTARATYASANRVLNRAVFNNNMFHKQNGSYPRFGDVIRIAKEKGTSNDRKFVLLGDPALQLAYPTERVVTTHINGVETGMRSDTLKALDYVTIAGKVTDDQGNLLNDFNGVVYPTVYDKLSEVNTHGDENGSPTSFLLRKSIIYQGLASVTNGRFEFSFMMPKDIAYNYGPGRISYYATNYEIDGHGHYENFLVGGFNEHATTDINGPEIRLFMNDTTFRSGDITDERPSMLAFVSDESGINTTGAGIGHDIVATISGETNLSAIVNDFYRADLDKSTSGTISYPFAGLNDGEHTLSLKVWDVFNNSNEASIAFVVASSGQMAIDNLLNYPNPFRDHTHFVFDHNQAGRDIDVEIQIFDINGTHVHTIKETITSDGYRSRPIRWNGVSNSGYALSNGLYVYRLLVTNENGEKNELRSKLIYMH